MFIIVHVSFTNFVSTAKSNSKYNIIMDGVQSTIKCNLEILHKQYQQIKTFQKMENSDDKTHSDTELSEEMKKLMKHMIGTIESMMIPQTPMYLRLLAMKTTLFYEQSKLLISLGKEMEAQEILITALESIKDVIFKSELIFLAFRIINHYAYLLSKQGEFEKSKELLEYAESAYKSSKKESAVIQFYASDDLFLPDTVISSSTDSSNKLERLVTNNLQMLGFIYNKQELHEKFAEYHHEVLRRQLEMKDGDVTMWALRSARLASYFLSKNRFKEARHHLVAAIHILYGYEKELEALEPSDNIIEKWDELQQRFADVAKCWVKYGLYLFSVSKTNIISSICGEPNQILEKLWTSPFKSSDLYKPTTSKAMPIYDDDVGEKTGVPARGFGDIVEGNSQPPLDVTDSIPKALPSLLEGSQSHKTETKNNNVEKNKEALLIFPSLDLAEWEEQVTASFIETTVQARELFQYTHSWLKRAKVFYTLQDHPMQYVNAILDLSELHRYLAFYEEDIETQYTVQKLRADALETLSTILKEVRPQCYIAVSVELLRELAEVQLEMMGLNLRRIYIAQEVVPETSDVTLHKMEALANIHSKLEHFNNNMWHNMDPIDSGSMPVSDIAGDVCNYVNT